MNRLVTGNLSLVTGDLQKLIPGVTLFSISSYQLPVTSDQSKRFMVPTRGAMDIKASHEPDIEGTPMANEQCAMSNVQCLWRFRLLIAHCSFWRGKALTAVLRRREESKKRWFIIRARVLLEQAAVWGAAALLPLCGATAATPSVLRGPYLQMGTPTSIVVRWRTDLAGVSRVSYGTNAADLASFVDGPASTTNHAVGLSNLVSDTTYYYAIGTTDSLLAGDTNYFFRTAPPIGSRRPIRIWALGDSGLTNWFARPVRDAYYNFTGTNYTDFWLMLGDNAYPGNSDRLYQEAVFNTYPAMLRQTVLWSTIGNQETAGAPEAAPTLPYFEIFNFPMNGEAGGLPSGTEKYYSFDYGNVHFVCLDSMSASSRVTNGPMATWLQADLSANTNDWLIAFWHHPPYSKGSHDSDNPSGSDLELLEMRTNFVPILEAYGVDLVLCGHSHSYERSFLIDGHYGLSGSFRPTMLKDPGDGRLDGSGAYAKDDLGPSSHEGAVYIVAGSGSQTNGVNLNHPAMYRSLNRLGSMVLDIHANRLEAKFIRETGAIDDHFTLIKGAPSLRILSATIHSGQVSLRWASVADRTYRVEFANDPAATLWQDASGPIRADGPETSWSVQETAGSSGGFYRVWSAGD